MITATAAFGLVFSFAHEEECIILTIALDGASSSIPLMRAYSSSVALILIGMTTTGLLPVQVYTLFLIAFIILLLER
jgi:hypothetical protein